MDIIKFPKAGVLNDRAVLYKHVFSKIRLKNSVIDHDTEQYKEQIFKVCIYIVVILEGGKGNDRIRRKKNGFFNRVL